MSYFRQNISVDLGSSTVLVCVENKGIVVKAPSMVAVKDGSGDVQAIGDEADELMGRAPEEISIVNPIRNGIISNYTTTTAMLKFYINLAVSNPLKKILKPDVMICIPCETTNVEKRAVEQAALEAGARRVYLVYGPLAAAVGSGIDINKPCGNLIVDIGGGTTDIAVISYGGIVRSKSVKVAGSSFDEAIKAYLKKNHGLLIGDKTAEEIKKTVGSVSGKATKDAIEIRGGDILTGLPGERVVKTEEIVDTLIETAMPILEGIHDVLESTPPELAADVYERGITLTGGGALLSGMCELLRKSTGMDAVISDNPEECAVIGSEKILLAEK